MDSATGDWAPDPAALKALKDLALKPGEVRDLTK